LAEFLVRGEVLAPDELFLEGKGADEALGAAVAF
jgi:hypothetical protein